MKVKVVSIVYFLLMSIIVFGQSQKIEKIKTQVENYNDKFQYEKSIKLLSDFISNDETAPYERYQAYLSKSYTYKRLFNYPKTLYNIELALQEGLKTDKVEEVKNNVKAEKSFVYFDTHEYKKATVLINELSKSGYTYLNSDDKAWVIMQEGYLFMLDKKYSESEKKLDDAIVIIKKTSPQSLPNIYGKKIELYNTTKNYLKRDESFQLGLFYAKKYNIIKYEMYIYEVMKNAYSNNKDYKNAFEVQHKFDSINMLYNTTNNNGKLELLEKKMEDEKQELKIKNEKHIKLILYGLIFFLLVLLMFSIRLYKTNKERRIFAEKENTKIHNEIERLTLALDEKGNAKFDLSKFDFSERQLEIIGLIKNSRTNKEIAAKLFISENTVKYHLKVIYEILDIENRTQIN